MIKDSILRHFNEYFAYEAYLRLPDTPSFFFFPLEVKHFLDKKINAESQNVLEIL